ncbi:MAG TPA: PRC-barrel domain-containing protein [Verrucomicrobiae bacterium]|nr:PRC-barrel domain-containing protein [Verrucomicrobiae bacterium]
MFGARVTQIFFVLTLGCGIASSPLRAQTNFISSVYQPLRVNRLIGMNVQNNHGQNLGKLRDFAFNTQTGKIRYVILASGGFVGVGVKLRAVPPQLLSAATAKRDTLALRIPKNEWENAPTLKGSELASLGNPAREKQIDEFYQSQLSESRTKSNSQKTNSSAGSALAATGSPGGEISPATNSSARLRLAGDLIGETIVSRDHEKVGDILDFLVGFEKESPVLALVATGKWFKKDEQKFAIPLRALSFEKNGDIILDANRKLLENAAPLDQKAWERAMTISGTPQIFRYTD